MQVRWIDNDTALVAADTLGAGKQITTIYACAAATLECHEVYDAGTSSVRLGP